MSRRHSPTSRTAPQPPWRLRRAPPVHVSFVFAALPVVVVALLTRPLLVSVLLASVVVTATLTRGSDE